MKSLILLLVVFTINVSFSQDWDSAIGYSTSFEEKESVFLFGDNVHLRAEPSAQSESLAQLPINAEVKVIEKSDEQMMYQGKERSWYKVKYKRQIGYILGGLLSLQQTEIDGYTYLATLKYVKGEYRDDVHLQLRVLDSEKNVQEFSTPLDTDFFFLKIGGNRGLENVQHIIDIDYLAEACGVDGGHSYIFHDGTELIQAGHVSEVGDGGVFYFQETLTFPNEKNGVQGKVLYYRVLEESVDELSNWMDISGARAELVWDGKTFSPSLEDLRRRERE